MKVYLIMIENKKSNVHYYDSIWEDKGDAERHIEWLTENVIKYGDEIHLKEERVYKHIG